MILSPDILATVDSINSHTGFNGLSCDSLCAATKQRYWSTNLAPHPAGGIVLPGSTWCPPPWIIDPNRRRYTFVRYPQSLVLSDNVTGSPVGHTEHLLLGTEVLLLCLFGGGFLTMTVSLCCCFVSFRGGWGYVLALCGMLSTHCIALIQVQNSRCGLQASTGINGYTLNSERLGRPRKARSLQTAHGSCPFANSCRQGSNSSRSSHLEYL
mmetsp:Transcript_10375/g.17426  ORF Transcript_10375/g.17426 Transcript_10375/m.17426 type:complete len:211 (+) Transcript_10375:98-730(+)